MPGPPSDDATELNSQDRYSCRWRAKERNRSPQLARSLGPEDARIQYVYEGETKGFVIMREYLESTTEGRHSRVVIGDGQEIRLAFEDLNDLSKLRQRLSPSY